VVSTELPPKTYRVTRADLVRYAGASGDFNPIHWSDRVATSVGLPGVIAHGMYTMALVTRAVTEWTGDPAAIVEVKVRFAKPVPVPDTDEGTEVVVSATVRTDDDGLSRLQITATCQGEKVLGPTVVTVRVPVPARS
jgi:acyl dehydratase